MNENDLRAGLKHIVRGLNLIIDSLGEPGDGELTEAERELGFMRDWGTRGLTKQEAAELCAKWRFPGQKISAWVRGDWAEIRDDERRYLTEKSMDQLRREDAKTG